LVSLSMPLQGLPMMYWYLLMGAQITLSIVMVIRYGGFTRQELGLTGNKWFLQILVGLIGIGLGFIEYLILRPAPLADEFTLGAIWFPALILVVFTSFLEEIIFRGLMQSAFGAKFGRWLEVRLGVPQAAIMPSAMRRVLTSLGNDALALLEVGGGNLRKGLAPAKEHPC
jgi:uncharacterized protein